MDEATLASKIAAVHAASRVLDGILALMTLFFTLQTSWLGAIFQHWNEDPKGYSGSLGQLIQESTMMAVLILIIGACRGATGYYQKLAELARDRR